MKIIWSSDSELESEKVIFLFVPTIGDAFSMLLVISLVLVFEFSGVEPALNRRFSLLILQAILFVFVVICAAAVLVASYVHEKGRSGQLFRSAHRFKKPI